MSLGCAIITYNEEHSIERTLKSVSFCDEIVVVDSGSSDNTLEIVSRYTDKFFVQEWMGYGKQKNFAISKLSTDWVLSVDADEVVTEALKEEIIKTLKSPQSDAYAINIQLIFLGKPLRFGGNYPDYHVRLFKKGRYWFREDSVHEGIEAPAKRLKNTMLHYSYDSIEDYFEKFNRYTSLAAEQLFKNNKRVSKAFVFGRFFAECFKRFVLKAAFLDGYEGSLFAFFSCFYSMVKYAKLKELDK
ncbi:glycosyltransferase family 2 protein [Hippea jasoniae]|uniref:glycosyltransferase family 2 protein n=1 Tax=Hippea jasoniae TaxID=944479 RepID=UPI000556A3CC|nr:glycosyltransferase family 2 protein [Hippea jasoniae]